VAAGEREFTTGIAFTKSRRPLNRAALIGYIREMRIVMAGGVRGYAFLSSPLLSSFSLAATQRVEKEAAAKHASLSRAPAYIYGPVAAGAFLKSRGKPAGAAAASSS
jgi:hypothetical protein